MLHCPRAHRQVRDALLRVGQGLGVRVRCGARVAAINTERGEAGAAGARHGRVTGVTLATGETIRADVVVSNRCVGCACGWLDSRADAWHPVVASAQR